MENVAFLGVYRNFVLFSASIKEKTRITKHNFIIFAVFLDNLSLFTFYYYNSGLNR